MQLAPNPEPTAGVLRIPRPPQGWTQVGTTPAGDPIFETEEVVLVRDKDGRPVREPIMDPATKQPAWIKHPTTGVAIRQKMRNKTRVEKRRYLLHVERNEKGFATGQHTKVPYTEDLARSIEIADHQKQVSRFNDELTSAAVSRGITPDELLNRILTIGGAVAEEEEIVDDSGAEWPLRYGKDLWYLSQEHRSACKSGETKGFRGTEDEARAEAARLAAEKGGEDS